jgi:hypothetical protein
MPGVHQASAFSAMNATLFLLVYSYFDLFFLKKEREKKIPLFSR